ncbi:hypothetical protein K1X84_06585 [bacterium]|nr:hypothetical protein [bacterium]
MKRTKFLLAILMLTIPSAFAQEEEDMGSGQDNSVGIGGVVDLSYSEGDKPGINNNTLGDNNFNKVRALTNFQFQHRDKLRADIEVLYDDASQDKIRLQGAFVTIFNLPNEKINLMIGKIPNLFGNFSKREFSDVNPLIGQPLMRQYRTTLDWERTWDNREQLILKKRRSEFKGQLPLNVLRGATPTVYDARWDFGIELFGNASIFDYQLGVTDGSISNPEAGPENDGKQFLGRLGINPVTGLNIGFSAAMNPYLSKPKTLEDKQRLLEAGKGAGEYKQRAFGADLEASYKYFVVFGEFVYSKWDAEVTEGELTNRSFYIDAKYKMHPRFYIAGRYDRMDFSKIENPATGRKETWDYNVQRVEGGFGFRITTDATVKVVGQLTKFEKGSGIKMIQLTAVQLSVPF